MLCKHLPFGYISSDDGVVVIDTEKGAYVRKILEMALEGLSQNKIASFLMEEGIRTSSGKNNWQDSTVRFILMNKKYYGEENFPAIISKDVFEKVSQLRSERYSYYNTGHSSVSMISRYGKAAEDDKQKAIDSLFS